MKDLSKSIVVTGLGMVTPLGHNTSETWDALMRRESGVGPITLFDASNFPTQIAAEVKDFNYDFSFLGKLQRYTNRFTQFAFVAAEEAFNDANLRPTAKDGERWGMVVGSGMMNSPHDYWEKFQTEFAPAGQIINQKFMDDNCHFFNPTDYARSTSNIGLSLLSQHYGIKGYSTAIHSACASGGQALGIALSLLQRGEVDYVLAGGYDTMTNPIGVSCFCLLGALSTDNDNPTYASRPFDQTRNGFVLGEGAAFMVLERYDTAKARGAKIYAELAGHGHSLNAFRVTDPPLDGSGPAVAVRNALKQAKVDSNKIDYINAHGTSTKVGDLSETNTIKAVFGDQAYDIPVSSTKSQVGHLIAAAGAFEGIVCVLAIQHSMMPMTCNLTNPDPECDLDYIIEGPRPKEIRIALSNSFGFGGTNSCLVFVNPAEMGAV